VAGGQPLAELPAEDVLRPVGEVQPRGHDHDPEQRVGEGRRLAAAVKAAELVERALRREPF
jgi:hypothetical protein